VIYFIQDTRSLEIKIGYTGSECVNTRLNALQTGNASRLKVLACVPGGMSDEAALHAKFASSRVGGEWFRPSPELLRHLAFVVIGQGMYQEGRERGRRDVLEAVAAFVGRDSAVSVAPTTSVPPVSPSPLRTIARRHLYAVGVLVKHSDYGTGLVTEHVPHDEPCLHKIKIRFPGYGEKTFLTEKAVLEVVPKAKRE
jgi:hypothetical protein